MQIIDDESFVLSNVKSNITNCCYSTHKTQQPNEMCGHKIIQHMDTERPPGGTKIDNIVYGNCYMFQNALRK